MQTFKEFINYLITKKKVKVHSGMFAFAIIPQDKPYCYKVYTNDKAFELWKNYCKNNSNNIHLPRYGSTKTFKNNFLRSDLVNDDIKVTKMEKLEPIKSLDRYDGKTILYIASMIFMNRSFEIFVDDFIEVTADNWQTTLKPILSESDYNNLQVIIDTLNDLHERRILRRQKIWLDMKDDNVMQRKDGTLVLTDIIADVEATQSRTYNIIHDIDFDDKYITARGFHTPPNKVMIGNTEASFDAIKKFVGNMTSVDRVNALFSLVQNGQISKEEAMSMVQQNDNLKRLERL